MCNKHFRHFANELSKEDQTSRGFEELSPYETAHSLFGNLQRGDKIAMTTRFHDTNDGGSVVQQYIDALKQRGLQVRLITNQTGVQDFCFLSKATKELVGVAKSTYVRWAGYLSPPSTTTNVKVRLYAIARDQQNLDHISKRQWNYTWTHPQLKSKLHLQVFLQQ